VKLDSVRSVVCLFPRPLQVQGEQPGEDFVFGHVALRP
jgi:hypothetical protein